MASVLPSLACTDVLKEKNEQKRISATVTTEERRTQLRALHPKFSGVTYKAS